MRSYPDMLVRFSIAEIMKICDIKDRKDFRERYFTPSLNDGAIERMFPGKPKHPG